MIPSMDENNIIVGTQLIVNKRNIYQFLCQDEKKGAINETPLFQMLGYKIFRNKFNSTYDSIMVYVTLNEIFVDQFDDMSSLLEINEKNMII